MMDRYRSIPTSQLSHGALPLSEVPRPMRGQLSLPLSLYGYREAAVHSTAWLRGMLAQYSAGPEGAR